MIRVYVYAIEFVIDFKCNRNNHQNCRAKCLKLKNYIASQAGAAGVTGLAVPSAAAALHL